MTALEKWLAAMEADKTPAAGTTRDALAELDEVTRKAVDTIGSETARLKTAAEIRGKIVMYQAFGSILHDLHTAEDEAPKLAPVPDTHPTLCSICGRREARVWDEGEPYCKRCARDEGIDFGGKV